MLDGGVLQMEVERGYEMSEIAMSDKLSLIIGHAFACAYRFAVWQSNC